MPIPGMFLFRRGKKHKWKSDNYIGIFFAGNSEIFTNIYYWQHAYKPINEPSILVSLMFISAQVANRLTTQMDFNRLIHLEVGEFMKFISMQLYNFKSFYGLSNPIEFGSSGDQNITLIFGGAGSGKSNIRKALIWLVYGDLLVPCNENSPIINAFALDKAKTGEELSYWVELTFKYQGKVCKVKRTQKLTKSGDTNSKDEDNAIIELHWQNEKNIWKQVKGPQLTIDKIFPVELYRYLIVDGEKLEELLTYEGRKQLLVAIFKIIGTNEYDLSDMTRFISNKIADSTSDLGISDLFQLNIADRLDNNWTDELSSGNKKIIGLSIIGAVIECLKTCNTSLTDLEYPLIIDSLFNSIDKDMASKLLPVLPELASQVIIMANNTPLEQLSKEELFKKVSNYYQLDSYDKGSKVRLTSV